MTASAYTAKLRVLLCDNYGGKGLVGCATLLIGAAILGLLAMVSTACGTATPASDAPSVVSVPESTARPEPSAAPTPPSPARSEQGGQDVEDVALRFYTAMFSGDTQTATELAITLDEMRALTKKPIEREEFDAALGEFVRPKDPNQEPVEVVRVEVVERGTLRAEENEKVTRDLEFAMVRPIVRKGGQEAPWMTRPFFKTDHGWKFSPKQ